MQEQTRDRRSIPPAETWVQDIRYAARSLRRSPGFALVAVLTLVAVSILFAAVAMLAAYLPARTATKVDSLVALRSE